MAEDGPRVLGEPVGPAGTVGEGAVEALHPTVARERRPRPGTEPARRAPAVRATGSVEGAGTSSTALGSLGVSGT
nr:hypothetical protein OG461_07225 [Streptomyces sp. NBC_00995]